MGASFRLLAAVAALALGHSLAAGTYHVSPTGADGNNGAEAAPWRTLSRAVSAVAPGDTVLVHAGVYNEAIVPAVSGTASAWIEFAAAPGEVPVIDGAALGLSGSQEALVTFTGGVSHVRLRGFEVRNLDNRVGAARDPIGIAFRGLAHHVEIVDCMVHGMTTHLDHLTPTGISFGGSVREISVSGGSVSAIRASSAEGNAHGIAAYGEQRVPIDAISVEGVEIFGLVLGTSEAVALNGNVTRFRIVGNRIYDNDNIGIDVIGFEGVGPEGFDQARAGRIAMNEIFNCSSRGNPAYEDYSAGGIYVDGGMDVLIEANRIHHCDIGMELASEAPGGTTRGVTARDNVLWHNAIGGLLLGGYDAHRGATEDCVIANNTFYENDTRRFQIGEVAIRHRAARNVLLNNLFKAGAQGTFVTFPGESAASIGNVLDGNGYFTTVRVMGWEWQGRWFASLDGFRAGSGQEARGAFDDPRFAGIPGQATALALQAVSPFIDKGLAQEVGDGRHDAAGTPRVHGKGIDVGAFEWHGELPEPPRVLGLRIISAAAGGGRLIRWQPDHAPLAGSRIEFSDRGLHWETIASGAPEWIAAEGVTVQSSDGAAILLDSRDLKSGLYRAVTEAE